MSACLDPFSFVVVSIAGWMNQHQQHVIEYLIKENRVLREQIGNRRMRFTNSQRSRLAAKAKKLSRKILENVATIVTCVQKLDLIETVGGGLPGFRRSVQIFELSKIIGEERLRWPSQFRTERDHATHITELLLCRRLG